MNYIVLYNPVNGKPESFGPFNSIEKARKWMKADLEEIRKASAESCGEELESYCNDNDCSIDGVGVWEIIELYKVL